MLGGIVSKAEKVTRRDLNRDGRVGRPAPRTHRKPAVTGTVNKGLRKVTPSRKPATRRSTTTSAVKPRARTTAVARPRTRTTSVAKPRTRTRTATTTTTTTRRSTGNPVSNTLGKAKRAVPGTHLSHHRKPRI
ncbi:hypothetical protein DIPPA_29878 [Diplonema papillatum]|nr:hypothetical protein DIPPA_29878 [Diplonema papillatum]